MHSEQLPVTLTDPEMKIVAEELGALELEMSAVRESKRASSKHFNALIEDLQERIALKADIAIKGQEYRSVECDWEPDLIAGVKRLIRKDTGTEVRNVILSLDEQQYGLFQNVTENSDGRIESVEAITDSLGALPDPETAVQEATADDPGDESYDASHANAKKRRKSAPEPEDAAVN